MQRFDTATYSEITESVIASLMPGDGRGIRARNRQEAVRWLLDNGHEIARLTSIMRRWPQGRLGEFSPKLAITATAWATAAREVASRAAA